MRNHFVLAAFGCLCLHSTFAWAAEPDLDQEQALAAIRKVGGMIVRENSDPAKSVIGIRFGCHSKLTDAELAHFKTFPDLQELSIVGEKVTDKGMEPLRHLSKLTLLTLNCTSVTDKGLDHLKGLTRLRKVHVRYSNCTEDGIKNLAKALPDAKITHIPHPKAR